MSQCRIGQRMRDGHRCSMAAERDRTAFVAAIQWFCWWRDKSHVDASTIPASFALLSWPMRIAGMGCAEAGIQKCLWLVSLRKFQAVYGAILCNLVLRHCPYTWYGISTAAVLLWSRRKQQRPRTAKEGRSTCTIGGVNILVNTAT